MKVTVKHRTLEFIGNSDYETWRDIICYALKPIRKFLNNHPFEQFTITLEQDTAKATGTVYHLEFSRLVDMFLTCEGYVVSLEEIEEALNDD
jgi:hypothetical protein